MHSVRNSIQKRLYTYQLSAARSAKRWAGKYWTDDGSIRRIDCANCRCFSASQSRCTVPFGSDVRKCCTAAQEANLFDLQNKDLLEIGFGKHSIPKRLVKSAGGTWTGIEPMLPTDCIAVRGKGGHGTVANIPFADGSFDVVAGIQSIEHWEEPLPGVASPPPYSQCLDEIHRVLRPAGSIYFCAPIHLHGHEMFIVGDIDRIRKRFSDTLWSNVVIERWRENYTPLPRYRTPAADRATWSKAVVGYPDEQLQDIDANGSVSLITIKAQKRA